VPSKIGPGGTVGHGVGTDAALGQHSRAREGVLAHFVTYRLMAPHARPFAGVTPVRESGGVGRSLVTLPAPLVRYLDFELGKSRPALEVNVYFLQRHDLVTELGKPSGIDVAGDARDPGVRPLLPSLVEWLHLVATVAEEGPVGRAHDRIRTLQGAKRRRGKAEKEQARRGEAGK